MKVDLDNIHAIPKSYSINIQTEKRIRIAKIKPFGFGTDVITVRQHIDTFTTDKWEKPEISWSSGGRDEKVECDLIASDNFIHALKEGQRIYVEWLKDYEEQPTED